jgi:iron complex transport system ATP-binding protein
METVGLTHLQDRLVTEISGGEKQLTSFARALAQEPEVMILDEPVSFLDVRHKTEILRLLLKLKNERNISIIAATHDIFSALFYFDKLIILKDGGILAEGEFDQVLTDDILSKAYDIEVTVRKEDGKIFVFPVG